MAIVFLLIAGCTKIEPIEAPVVESAQPDRIVSIEQAEAFAQQAVSGLLNLGNDAPMTRAITSNDESIAVKNVITLSSNSVPALYIVNFANDGGYMAISADKEQTNPMVMFSDIGNFDQSLLEEESPFALYVNGKVESISTNIRDNASISDDSYAKWENLGSVTVNEKGEEIRTTIELISVESLGDEVRLEVLEQRQEEFPETRARYRTSKGLAYVSPGESYWIEWGQAKGYNADAPRPNVDLAGCAAVAIGKLCYMNKFPTIYPYYSMPDQLSPTTVSNPISRMLRDIGNKIPGYSWGSSATNASLSGMLSALRTLGYTSAQDLTYDFYRTYTNMRDGYPVILTAQSSNVGAGHAWLCNGYQEFVWKVTETTKILGIVVKRKTWYEYADYLYMNWGWYGGGNAWIDQEDWRAQHPTRGEVKWDLVKRGFYYLIPR